MKYVLLTVVLALTACATPAPDPVTVLVAADYQASSGSASLRAFRSASTAMGDEFYNAGHDVIEASAIDGAGLGGVNRTTILDRARDLTRPPVDVVAVYRIVVSERNQASGVSLRVRVEADLISVSRGKIIGSGEQSRTLRLAPDCIGRCRIGKGAEISAQLAREVGVLLVAQLGGSHGVRGDRYQPIPDTDSGLNTSYEFSLSGFNSDEMENIQSSLENMKGYDSMRLSYSDSRSTKWRYSTSASSAFVLRELDNALKKMGLNASVQFSGNQFRMQKITTRPSRPAPRPDLRSDGINQW